MEELYKGIYKFQTSYFKKEKNLFKNISKRQMPKVLFITCSDSRIDPNLITQSKPGELFIIRNIGNVIPPYNSIKDKNSTIAAIEFAVLKLKVSDIIVCGHSNCGAIQLLDENNKYFKNMPHLKNWLKIAKPVKNLIKKSSATLSKEDRQMVMEKENIIIQLTNIHTYSFIRRLLRKESIHIHGWYYDIGTGNIYSYKPEKTKKVEMEGLMMKNMEVVGQPLNH